MGSKISNVGALGLCAFGMTTLLTMYMDFVGKPTDSLVWGMMIFYGGLTQFIVGILESKKGNTFGTVAFTSYGAFWLSFAFMNIAVGMGGAAAPEAATKGMYFFGWFFLTLVLFFGTFRTTRALQLVFGLLATVFFGLMLGSFLENANVIKAAAAIGMFLGMWAMYTGLAETINEVYDRSILPLFPINKN